MESFINETIFQQEIILKCIIDSARYNTRSVLVSYEKNQVKTITQ